MLSYSSQSKLSTRCRHWIFAKNGLVCFCTVTPQIWNRITSLSPYATRPPLGNQPIVFLADQRRVHIVLTPSALRPSLSPVNHTVAPLSTASPRPLPARHYLRTRELLNESRRLNDLYKIFVYTNTMLKETKRRYWGGIFAIVDTV